MQTVEHYVALHRTECAVLDCTPARPEWVFVLDLLAYPAAIALGLALFMALGVSGRLSGWLDARSWRPFLKDGASAVALVGFVWLACLPVSYLKRFVLGGNGGISITGPMPDWYEPPTPMDLRIDWLTDEIALLVSCAALVFIAVPPALWLLRLLGRWYWIAPAAVFAIWVSIGTLNEGLEPVHGLPETPLGEDIAAIAGTAGVDPDRVLVGEMKPMYLGGVDLAYVTWQGGKQIALIGDPFFNVLRIPPENYNPTPQPVTAAEVRAVAAHEIAHLKHNHLVIVPMILAGIGLLVSFLIAFALRKSGAEIGRRTSLPMIVLAFGAAFMAMVPVRANIWRVAEHQADATALELARDPEGAAMLALRLSRGNSLDRPTLTQVVLSTHPDGLDRIERAVVWGQQNAPAEWQASGISGAFRRRTGDTYDRLEPFE